jgi:hypothetical protein
VADSSAAAGHGDPGRSAAGDPAHQRRYWGPKGSCLAGGAPFGEDSLKLLAPLLSTGKTFRLEIERDGIRTTIDVTPLPRPS